MRRSLMTLALVGLFGTLLTSDASACCHKKKCVTTCAPACAPAPCVVEAPAPPPPPAPCPAPCPPPKCCGLKKFRLFGFCHKKQVCAPVAYYAPCAPVYAAPYASGQGYAVPSGQGY